MLLQQMSQHRKWRLNLKFLIALSSILTAGLFIFIMKLRLQFESYFPRTSDIFEPDKWIDFASHKSVEVYLAVSVACWLYFWRRAYNWEHDLLFTLFARGRVPEEFSSASTFYMSAALTVVFNAAFLLLSHFVTDVRSFSATLLVILGIDLISTHMTRNNLRRYMDDYRFAPSTRDELGQFVLRRREIAMNYVYERPHALRQLAMFIVMCVATLALYLEYPNNEVALLAALTGVAYVVFGNEFIVASWRSQRDKAFERVDLAQAEAERVLYGLEEATAPKRMGP